MNSVHVRYPEKVSSSINLLLLKCIFVYYFVAIGKEYKKDLQIPFKMSDELSQVENSPHKIAKVLTASAHWEDFLTPAPMCIAFLGERIFMYFEKLCRI